MRRAAWWRSRAAAVRATVPALTPPDSDQPDGTSSESGGVPLGGAWGEPDQDGCVRVHGAPLQGELRLSRGCALECATCGASIAATLTVVAADEGWCVATVCACAGRMSTRESGFYREVGEAWAALDRGDYEVHESVGR